MNHHSDEELETEDKAWVDPAANMCKELRKNRLEPKDAPYSYSMKPDRLGHLMNDIKTLTEDRLIELRSAEKTFYQSQFNVDTREHVR